MEKPLQSLSDVSGTMLITLFARAKETQSKHPIIRDPLAVEIIEIFKKELVGSNNLIHKRIVKGRYNSLLSASMSLRSRRFDRYVQDFLKQNPEGTVINFGCGLDTRFDRIDNGKVHWFDIDFPPVIALRRRFMKESDRRIFIEGSILEDGWTEKVKTRGPYLILAEGVFMYLKEEQVKSLLQMVVQKLGKAELVCEVSNRYWVDRMNTRYFRLKFKYQLGMEKDSVFTFGIPDGRYFESWDPAYHFLDEWTYFDDDEKRLRWMRILTWIKTIRYVQWTVHYQIGG